MKISPTATTTTTTTICRLLELDAEEVESIVREWAIKHHGFLDPKVESLASWDGLFSGMTIEETASHTETTT